MSLYDSIFGTGQNTHLGQHNMTTQLGQNAASQADYSMNTQRDQRYVQQAFNQALGNMNQNPYATRTWVSHPWVFNNQPCTLQEFADAVWGTGEHEDKMLFLLTHSGPDK